LAEAFSLTATSGEFKGRSLCGVPGVRTIRRQH
jgi:hypothetical protein